MQAYNSSVTIHESSCCECTSKSEVVCQNISMRGELAFPNLQIDEGRKDTLPLYTPHLPECGDMCVVCSFEMRSIRQVLKVYPPPAEVAPRHSETSACFLGERPIWRETFPNPIRETDGSRLFLYSRIHLRAGAHYGKFIKYVHSCHPHAPRSKPFAKLNS